MVSLVIVKGFTSLSVVQETIGNVISVHGELYQWRRRKVENVSSSGALIAFAESSEPFGGLVLDPESTFLC